MTGSRRWWSWLAFAAGVVLALAMWRQQWRLSELPATFPAGSLAYPVRVDALPAADAGQLRFLAESWPPGSALDVIDAAGTVHPVTVVLRQGVVTLVLTGISGLVFLVAAGFFLAVSPGRTGVGGFFWVSFLYGLGIMAGGIFYPRDAFLPVAAIDLVQIVCLALLPVVFLRLALAFPCRSAVLDRRPRLVPALFALAAAIVAWQAAVHLRYFRAPTPARAAALGPALTAADLFLVVVTLTGVAVFARRAGRLELTRERNQVRWLLWGFAIGAAPYVFLRTLPSLLGVPPLLPVEADRVIELAIPLAFVMAVVRDQFLDIDVIIRRSLLYGLLAAALLGLYLAAGVVFGTRLGPPPGVGPWLPPVVLGLGAGVAFLPLRRLLGRWIDRTFFQLARDHDRALARLDRDLGEATGRAAVAAALQNRLAEALTPRTLGIGLARGDDVQVTGPVDAAVTAAFLASIRGRPGGLVAAPRSTSLPEVERPDFPGDLRGQGVVLAQILDAGSDQAGALLLGPRATERRYVEQDLAFLAAAGGLAGRHLERIGLVQAVAEETLARQRLAELDRLKSEFLAHVAHDLRTPVAGIAWSARNLLDGVVGDLPADQAEYVQAIARSGAHLNRLVDNLLEISRLDRGEVRFVAESFDPAAVWRDAAAGLHPFAEAKGVAIAVIGGGDGHRVRGSRDRLAEVAVNLLDNAVKYTAPDTTVTVTVLAPDAGALDVAVRDRGPGLGGQDTARLFGRFVQGVPSPYSSRRGFGLGLHIAATYLAQMDGALTAADHPDGGAVFTCSLPLAPTPERRQPEGAEA